MNATNLIALCADAVSRIEGIGQNIWLSSKDLDAIEVKEKAAGDVATQIDLWAETELKSALLKLAPDSLFLGEETGGVLTDEPTWIVDPIDGTANFVRGYPQWSMSIALVVQGLPVLGVVYDPNRQEMFYATRGHGAWLQSRKGLQRLRCAAVTEPLKATVSTVFPKPLSPLMQPYLKELEMMLTHVAQVRRAGSMALELAYVAAGRADAFWERGMQAWDMAAGWLLLEEAGAAVLAMDGLPLLSSQYLAAGSPNSLPWLQQLLNRAGHSAECLVIEPDKNNSARC